MRANSLLALILVGLLVGALAGYLTRPQAAELKLGPINLEVQSGGTARSGDPLTGSQFPHIAIFGLIGAAFGAGLGFALSYRKR